MAAAAICSRAVSKSVAVSRDEWALALSRYLHLNPVQGAGLGQERAAGATRGFVTSARRGTGAGTNGALAGLSLVWKARKLVGMSDGPGLGRRAKAEQQQQYREDVERAVREGLERSPWEDLQEQVVLGGAEFLAKLRKHLRGHKQEHAEPAVMVLYLGRRVCGMKLAELAKAVGLGNDAVVATNVRRYERRLQSQRGNGTS